MKITLSPGSLVDDILADSALNAIFNQNSALLTADHRPALLRAAIKAAATVAGKLSGSLTALEVSDDGSEIRFETLETEAHPDALEFHFATAVSFATLRLVAISIGDHRRADAYKGCLADSLATLETIISAPPRRMTFRPWYC